MENNKNLLLELRKKDDKINDLLVLVDTLQTNLKNLELHLIEEEKLLKVVIEKSHNKNKEVLSVPSLKWCKNWKNEI
tara:strand:- start:1322 stop:1552 length:231 start_codon:yes stop_codon:yes gene_type:complete